MSPPSHVTAAQAARILKLSKQTIYRKSFHGEPLESEKHFGTDMIPLERIKLYASERQIQLNPKFAEAILGND